MAPIRLLMTVDAVGGVWNYSLELLKGLPDYEILLVGLGPAPSPEQLQSLSALLHVTYLYRPYALEWMEDSQDDVKATGQWLMQLQDEFDPDLVHLNGFTHAALPWRVYVLAVAHSSICTWWPAVYNSSLPSRYAGYEANLAEGLRAADRVLAPTQTLLKGLALKYGPFKNSCFVPNGHSISIPRPGKKELQIASAGRIWDEAKNLMLLERIAPSLDLPVFLAGQVREKGATAIGKNVQLLGSLESAQMYRLLEASAIYAAPALYEPFGLAILEAAAHGCALVLADIPSLRENWDGAALFIDPRDDAGWIATCNRLGKKEKERRRMGHLAQVRSRRFTSKKMVASYRRIYSQMLPEPSTATARFSAPESVQSLVEELG